MRLTHCHQIPTKAFDLGGGVKFTHELAFTKGVACANCHRDVIRGNGDVPRERCLSCHSREGDLAKYNDVVFMHQEHVTVHKVDCIKCHTPIEHNLERNKIEHAVSECQSCHPDHHQQQVNMLRGIGAKTLGAEPNLMVEVRVECRTCHRVAAVSPVGAAILRGSLQACARCDTAGDVQQFEAYHLALRNALPVLEESLGKVESAAKNSGHSVEGTRRIAVEAADLRHDLDMLNRGNDVHNMHFAANLVRQTLARLVVLCREAKIEPPKVALPPLDAATRSPKTK